MIHEVSATVSNRDSLAEYMDRPIDLTSGHENRAIGAKSEFIRNFEKSANSKHEDLQFGW
jgi:hypothetical protein